MKTLYLLATLIFTMSLSHAQDNYYWYKGKKVPVQANTKKKFVLFKEEKSKVNEKSALSQSDAKVKESWNKEIPGSLNAYKGKKPKVRASAIIESEKAISKLSDKQIAYQAPFYETTDGEEAPLTDLFYVKLKKAADVKKLEKMAAKYNAEILGNNKFMPLWYTLSAAGSSEGNALTLANAFYESNQFAAAEPEFLFEIKSNCANDQFFGNQWGFDNTGQGSGIAGIDANICEAWNYTQGAQNITVAIVDEGVELTHPDLTNIHPVSFDAHTGTSPSVVRGDHGTKCAGIVGADANNNAGVAGVAPNTQVMSVSIRFGSGGSSPAQFADAINFAWQNGADVISNSWYYNTWQTQIMDDAIQSALDSGRGGLGTIVVFSAGNTDGAITNPADNNPRTLVVGAMSECGERKSPSSCDGETWWGSSYGTELDVVAPGVHIPTTDLNGGYTQTFNGTSSAAPHAAGLVALLLSVDSSLTQQDVSEIIEQTAQKVGSYNYATTSGRPNGTWHNEMGYGLIDAKVAVESLLSPQNLLTTYNVPRSSAIPAGYRQFSNVHTIGVGGPDLSNVFNSVFNWQGSSSQPTALYQFTLETTNGSPRYYTNIPDYGSYMLHQASPEITINSSIGFSGMEGSYWVNLDGNNLVLVEKSGNYALYFSNSSTPPSSSSSSSFAFGGSGVSSLEEQPLVHPNPFNSEAALNIPAEMGEATVIITNAHGHTVETFRGEGQVTFGKNYKQGVYTIKIVGSKGVKQTSFIKQ